MTCWGLQIILTVLADLRQLQVARIGSPLPNAGEGLGVRGYLSAASTPETRL